MKKIAIIVFLGLFAAGVALFLTAPKPAAWETRSGFDFENRGVARIESGPNGWVMTIQCGETHSFNVDYAPGSAKDFFGKPLRIRYSKSTKSQTVQCFQAPCPAVEVDRYVIMQMTELSPEQANAALAECGK